VVKLSVSPIMDNAKAFPAGAKREVAPRRRVQTPSRSDLATVFDVILMIKPP
jgi:hypothetical protein